jgi:hypothetical protein
MKYPNKCCRCGYCCLTVTCPSGVLYYGIDKRTPCPALTFNTQSRAKCGLVKHGLVPIGDGCCIKARAYKDGVEYDFASLPSHLKKRAAADFRDRLSAAIKVVL